MRKQFLAMFLALVMVIGVLPIPALAAEESPGYQATTLLSDVVTNNISKHTYQDYANRWGDVVNSNLAEDSAGNLVRVEYTDGDVLVETYSAANELLSSKTIEGELSLFGGFFSGKDNYYLVFGQNNHDQSNDVEVMRIVKYSKDWERLDDTSVFGANTYEPFSAGTLSMTEANGLLYVYTCHKMYTSDDGYNHQSNMTFVIDEGTMAVKQSLSTVSYIGAGYVSHSFYQLIRSDGTNLYRVDLGDCYPRAVSLTKCGKSITYPVSYTEPLSIVGTPGANDTGVMIGGFELSSDNCLIVGTTVDQSSQTNIMNGAKNVFLTVTGKDVPDSDTSLIMLTSYAKSDRAKLGNPQLVKINDDSFLIMWEEKIKTAATGTKMCTVDGNGNLTSNIISTDFRLSDCQPILTSDGYVKWYVTDGSSVTLYTVDPNNLHVHNWDEGKVTTEPTCSSKGVKTFTCTGCNTTKTEDIAIAPDSHTWDDGTITTEPTCTDKGVKTFTCTGCKITKTEDVDISPDNHVWDEGEVTTEPTCADAGEKSVTCTVCGTTGTVTIPATGKHTPDDGKDCSKATLCTVCGTELKAAGEHLWNDGEITTKATCEEDGVKTFTCSECGETKTEKLPAKGGHSWNDGEVTTAATCVKAGIKTYACTECDATTTETISATGEHTWGDGEITTAATCDEDGVETLTCSVCGKTETEAIPATENHSWDDGKVTTAPTCSDDGVKTYTCTECDATTTEKIPATGDHTWDDGKITTEATCSKDGVKTFTCSVCKETKTEPIPATGSHSWDDGKVTTAPTCVDSGVKTYTCTECDTTTTESVSATGEHAWNDGEITTEATCAKEGEKTITCTVCKATKTETISATGKHTPDSNADCEKDTVCTVCGAVIKAAGNHSWDDGKITTEATCSAAGVKTFTCTVCGATKTEAISATGKHTPDGNTDCEKDTVCTVCGAVIKAAGSHSWDDGKVTTEATCSAAGVKTFTCTVCKATKTETISATGKHTSDSNTDCEKDTVCTVCGTVIKAAGSHSWDGGKVTTDATCSATGVKTYTCTVCGTTKTETISATGEHTWNEGEVTTDATCADDGIKTFTCTVCNATKTETVPATDEHAWSEWTETKAATTSETGTETRTCSTCGKEETREIPVIYVAPRTSTVTSTPVAVSEPEKAETVDVTETYDDISGDDWYSESVSYVVNNGLMSGDDGSFEPDEDLSRAELIKILFDNEYDPASSDGADDAIAWASENELIKGYLNGELGEDDSLTREQLAVILYRYAVMKGYDVSQKSDLAGYEDSENISDYALEAMQWANANGLMIGTSGTTLEPTSNASRAQVATVLMRFFENVAK